MRTTKQKFTATFSTDNGKASGEISFQCHSFDDAKILVKEVLREHVIWSLMSDEDGNEIFNNELDDFTPLCIFD